MLAWSELVKAAAIGTERQAPAIAANGDGAGALLARLDPTDREGQLLAAAAIAACCRRAGHRPVVEDGALPADPAAEDLPCCPDAAAQDLARMLGGEFADLLEEWLRAAAARGLRVPAERLPDLLERGVARKDIRGLLLLVLGGRGRWLAGLNPNWRYGASADVAPDPAAQADQWHTGTHEERMAVLRSLRQGDPAHARALVEETWAQDPPEERAVFLEAFADGLSLADEPFLEAALDDRRKEVRSQAAGLLARLPESRLCARMFERAQPLLTLRKAFLGRESLEVALPETCDKAMARDGIEAKPAPGVGMGERAWWLYQMLARVPPSRWERHFSKTAADLIAANRSREWASVVLQGWSRAAQRSRDRAWAGLLLDAWIDQSGGQIPTHLARWSDVLSGEALESRAARLVGVSRGPLTGANPALDLLRHCPGPWGAGLARAVLANAREHLRRPDARSHGVALTLEEFAGCIPEAMAGELAELWREATHDMPHLLNRLERHLAAVEFRQDMLRHIEGR